MWGLIYLGGGGTPLETMHYLTWADCNPLFKKGRVALIVLSQKGKGGNSSRKSVPFERRLPHLPSQNFE